MTNVIILRAPDGAIAYMRPAGRRLRLDLPGGDVGMEHTPDRQMKDGEDEAAWIEAVRADTLAACAATLGGLDDRATVPLVSPDGPVSLEWLSHNAGRMRRSDILAHLSSGTLSAEPVDVWLDRVWLDARRKWQEAVVKAADDERQAKTDIERDKAAKCRAVFQRMLSFERAASIPAAAVPTDPLSVSYRPAWAWETPDPVIDIDAEKARGIRLERLRARRDALLKALDVDELRAVGDDESLKAVRDRKQRLRDAPKELAKRLSEASTLAEIDAISLTE